MRRLYSAFLFSASAAAPLVFLISAYLFFVSPPADFPRHSIYQVTEGESVRAVAERLQEAGIVRRPFLFAGLLSALGENGAIAGTYFFEEPLDVFMLSERIAYGDYGLEPVRVRILEGSANRDVAARLASEMPQFDPVRFLRMAEEYEGFLFPDTYFFSPAAAAEDVFASMRDNFRIKTEGLRAYAKERGEPFSDIVTMASLLEREAHTYESKQKIAGVLWKRLRAGMPLQVDAAFLYFLGKNTFELSLEDLATDSPYNTYKYAGLPPGPIGNPGLDSIRAALYYDENPFWFYLSDLSGNIYFAETFGEHVANKRKYLNNI